jgi:hypothetical protein
MEIWKDVKGYEGIYEVSSLGRVKSLKRIVIGKYRVYNIEEKILKYSSSAGYLQVPLCKNNIEKTRLVHQLVAEAFLNHTSDGYKMVVDHINNIKKDNRVENLQVITQRQNITRKKGTYTSKYIGVCYVKKSKKWRANICFNGKQLYLGEFKCELKAAEVYQRELKKIENGKIK